MSSIASSCDMPSILAVPSHVAGDGHYLAHVLAEALSDGMADSQRRVQRGQRIVPATACVSYLCEVADRLGQAVQTISEAVGQHSESELHSAAGLEHERLRLGASSPAA